MLWLKLAWRNIKRNSMRSLICILAIGGGIFVCAFIANLNFGSYQQFIRNAVLSGSGHLALYHHQYPDTREQEYHFSRSSVQKSLQSSPFFQSALANSCARFSLAGLAKSARNSEGIILSGVELAHERKTNLLFADNFLQAGTWFSADQAHDAVIGNRLAEKLGLKPGSKFVVMVQDQNGEVASGLFYVRGILHTGVSEIDGNMVISDLKNVQNMFGASDQVHEITLLLQDSLLIDEAVEKASQLTQEISADLAVLPWSEAMPQVVSLMRFNRINAAVAASFLFLIVGLGVVNIFSLSVMDRVREFGVLRAMGLQARLISWQVVLEALLLSFLGITSGLIAALTLSLYTHHYGIDFSNLVKEVDAGGILIDLIIYTGWAWHDILILCTVMLFLCFSAALYPAFLANKIRVAEAVRC